MHVVFIHNICNVVLIHNICSNAPKLLVMLTKFDLKLFTLFDARNFCKNMIDFVAS